MFKNENIFKKLEDFRELRIEKVNLPCDKCNGDCCSASTPFSKEELNTIKKEFPTILKRYKLIDTSIPDTYTLKQKGSSSNKCVFYKKDKCSIYKVRPRICRDFGEKMYSPCAFNNLTQIPTSKDEQDKLAEKCQAEAFKKMNEIAGTELNLNIVPARAKNVFM